MGKTHLHGLEYYCEARVKNGNNCICVDMRTCKEAFRVLHLPDTAETTSLSADVNGLWQILSREQSS